MAVSKNQIRDKVWSYLRTELKMNEYGASGFMGNLYSESAIDPNCMEELLAQRYNEDSSKYKNVTYIQGYKRPVNAAGNIAYNSQRYTRFIDNGVISKVEFLHPRSYTGKTHQYGYGLCQWTTEARKKRLWANTVEKGKSIADLNGQLQTLKQELTSTYKSVLQVCQNAESITEASDYILVHFESPANANSMKSTRRNYSQQFYTLYHGTVVKQNKSVAQATKSAKDLDVDDFLVAVKAVCDYARIHNYQYGDSHATPPTADGIISCDRMFARALWDRGFTDQPVSTTTTSGITNGNMDSYLTSHGWIKGTNFSDIRKGSIVQVHNTSGALHCFVVVSYDAKNNTFTKYDCGSKARIDAVQPFKNEKWQYKDLVAVYNFPQEKKEVKTEVNYNIQNVENIQKNEVGYCEKRSNSNLDSKTGNAGKGNFTKYWRDIKPSYQGQSWCLAFQVWSFRKAYGYDAANYLLCGGVDEYYTPTAAQYFKNKGQWHTGSDVKRGDLIFFKNSQRIHHVGFVTDVKNGRIYTIEGNTSNGTAVVANGGMVCAKNYRIGLSTIAGYGRPNYGAQTSNTTATGTYDYHSIYDDAYYKAKYPDIAKAYGSKNAYEHYVTYGVKEGRSPSATFDPAAYRKRYSDLDEAYGDNWEGYAQHYITFGAKEGRNAKASDGKTGTVTTTLNVRVNAGTTYPLCKTFGPLPTGTKVEIIKKLKGTDGNQWYHIKYNGKEGYVSAKYVEV